MIIQPPNTNLMINADSLTALKKLPDNSVDSVVTDPPYGLSFMGKKWDYDVPSVELWKEVFRVMKPGAFLLSFAGTRTYHRMAVNIEDAGFEIRDMISWLYASGFPKSLNIYKQIQKVYKGGNTSIEHNGKQKTEHNLRPLSETNLSETINSEDKQGKILQSELSEQSSYETMQGKESKKRDEDGKESSMEGGSDLLQDKRKLQRCEICKMSKEISCYVPKGWLYHGTQINNGEEVEKDIIENGSDTPHRPQSNKQQDRESYAICEQCRTQTLRRWEGWGTALKPACEPIVVARKPLSEKTVALNVLKWGTGGINIDGCRVGASKEDMGDWNRFKGFQNSNTIRKNMVDNKTEDFKERVDNGINIQGRFPANIILDEEARKILDEQSGISESKKNLMKGGKQDTIAYGNYNEINTIRGHNDKGGASRFFYCAKASKSERNLGCEDMEEKQTWASQETRESNSFDVFESDGRPKTLNKNNHPTVKPVKLMQYLVRLVTPKGAICLDPFFGSGTTGIACIKEGMNYIGIEREKDYIKIAEARIKPFMEQTKLNDVKV